MYRTGGWAVEGVAKSTEISCWAVVVRVKRILAGTPLTRFPFAGLVFLVGFDDEGITTNC